MGNAQGGTFEEALASAESAFFAQQWESAVSGYSKAQEVLEKKTNLGATDEQKQEAQIRDRLAMSRLYIAQGLARDNQLAAATDAAEKIIHEAPKSTAAPNAAFLALQAFQVLAN